MTGKVSERGSKKEGEEGPSVAVMMNIPSAHWIIADGSGPGILC